MLADPENLLEVLLEIYYCGAPSDPPPHTRTHRHTHSGKVVGGSPGRVSVWP